MLSYFASRGKKLIIASAIVLAAGIIVFVPLYWHLYIVNYAQLSLWQRGQGEDGNYLINVQNVSAEAIEENPKLGRVFAQVTEKYNKMVTEDCTQDEEYFYYTPDGEYCDPLHYTQTTISLTPEELESLVKEETGIDYLYKNYESFVFSGDMMYVWEAQLRLECQYSPDGSVSFLLEGAQEYCYYYLELSRIESDFLTRLLMFGPK